ESILWTPPPPAPPARSPPMTSGRSLPSTNSRAAGERAWAVAVAIDLIVSARRRRPAARARGSAPLDQRQRGDHRRRGDRDAQIPPRPAVRVREPARDPRAWR